MNDCIYIQTAPDIFIVGESPFTFTAARVTDQHCFYVNDFFLQSSKPWITPARTHVLSKRAFVERFSDFRNGEGDIEWTPVSTKQFEESFYSAKLLFEDGCTEKIVPILFENGLIPSDWMGSVFEILTARQVNNDSSQFAYGFSFEGGGFCGITPEVLFSITGDQIQTAALAGTKDARLGTHSIENLKDSREHSLVIEDIATQLNNFGKSVIGATKPETIGTIIHLRTPITIHLSKPVDFNEIVSALHPTAALGAYPRSDKSMSFLKELDRKQHREIFGAPFGICMPDGKSFCLVAIRCVQWNELNARIGSGCGLISESILEEELSELLLKRESVKSRLRRGHWN